MYNVFHQMYNIIYNTIYFREKTLLIGSWYISYFILKVSRGKIIAIDKLLKSSTTKSKAGAFQAFSPFLTSLQALSQETKCNGRAHEFYAATRSKTHVQVHFLYLSSIQFEQTQCEMNSLPLQNESPAPGSIPVSQSHKNFAINFHYRCSMLMCSSVWSVDSH